MATAGAVLSREQLLCPICLDLFSKPVSTACGHNFCSACIHGYWRSTNVLRCPMCKHKFCKKPELKVNILIAELTCRFKRSEEHEERSAGGAQESRHVAARDKKSDRRAVKTQHSVAVNATLCEGNADKKAQIRRVLAEVEKTIYDRLLKVSKVVQQVKESKERTETELAECLQIFDKLLESIHRSEGEVVEKVAAAQRHVDIRADEMVRNLSEEIDDLKKRSHLLKELLNSDECELENISALMPPGAGGLCAESVAEVTAVRRAFGRLADELEETVKTQERKLCRTEVLRAQQRAVDVTLDPDTAHPKLVLSDDKKQVHHRDEAASLPDNPERFYPGISILGKEGFSSGTFYFQVCVKGKTEWDVGVCAESVNRKGGDVLKPENGYWILGLRRDQSYWALGSLPVRVPLPEIAEVIGVYVDVDGGQVSFYDPDSAEQIYSFTGCDFNERVFPFLNPRRNHGGVNSAPLTISPVNVST
ncbi:zinc-binding protein A33-like [Neosynchiropus ocellatus]